MLRWRIALDTIRGIVTFLELTMVTTLIAIAKALLEMGSWWTLCNSIVQNSESRLLDLVCGHHVLVLAFLNYFVLPYGLLVKMKNKDPLINRRG